MHLDYLRSVNVCLLMVVFFNERSTQAHMRPSYCADNQPNKNTFLWQIDHPDLQTSSYFFGTIHVPYHQVWDYASSSVRESFDKSNSVYFELDLSDYNTLKSLAVCQLLPSGQYLSDRLPNSLYARLTKYLSFVKRTIPLWLSTSNRYPHRSKTKADQVFKQLTENWRRKRPIWLLLMLNSLNAHDLSQRMRSSRAAVLDQFLAQRAQAAAKQVGAIEKVAEQCDPLNSLNLDQVVFALNLTLSRLEVESYGEGLLQRPHVSPQSSSALSDLVEHYNCGSLDEQVFNRDAVALPTSETRRHLVEKARRINSHFKTQLIDKRNVKMAERTVLLMRNDPTRSYFFAFGAGHFLGDNSVIELVKTAGYNVRPITDEHRDRGGSVQNRDKPFFGTNGLFSPPSPFPLSDRQPFPIKTRQFKDLWVKIEGFSAQPPTVATASSQKQHRSDTRPHRNSGIRLRTDTSGRLIPLTLLASLIPLLGLRWRLFF